MELNITSTPKTNVTKVVSNNKVSAQLKKGNWKKRRQAAVKTRVRVERQKESRKHGSRNGVSDEFASGIYEKKEEPSNGEAQDYNDKYAMHLNAMNSNPRKRGRSQYQGNGKLGYSNGNGNINIKGILKKGKTTNLVQEKDTEETIGATLDIVGGHLADKHKKMRQHNAKDTTTPEQEHAAAAPGAAEATPDTDKEEKDAEDAAVGAKSAFGAEDFESIGLYASVAKHLKHRMLMEKPTQIQARVISALLNIPDGALACDILVRSSTGSGKTLSYLLPIAHYMLQRRKRISREEGAYAVIIVPTRELAEQVESVAAKVLRPWHWIVVGSVRGGEGKKSEKARLRKGVNILVATPGRLLDHLRNTRSFTYSLVEFLVLDEADRLLDLGFEADIKNIIDILDRHRHRTEEAKITATKYRSNIMLSATMTADIERLAKFSLEEPIQISLENGVGDENGDGTTKGNQFHMPDQLRQHLCVVEQRHRLVTLAAFLRLRALRGVSQRTMNDPGVVHPTCKIMVFFSTCDSVDFHHDILRKADLPDKLHPRGLKGNGEKQKLMPVPMYRLHGGMEQADRLKSLRAFRECQRGILLCTDVAARGLDLQGVGFAMQYDPPTGGAGEELEYVHRAGRTARLGKQGDALLFLLPSERAYKSKLEKSGVTIKEISNNTALAALLPGVRLTDKDNVAYSARLVTSELQEAMENTIKAAETGSGVIGMKEKAYSGYLAYCRAYATHAKDVKHYFHVRNLHLGHVARAFALTEKPAELGPLLAEMKATAAAAAALKMNESGNGIYINKKKKLVGDKRAVSRAIADGEKQPYNDQNTQLSRRRRERGVGAESLKELASEFAS